MRIVRLVTTYAGRRQRGREILDVARFARQRPMAARQRKARYPRVIETWHSPRGRVMAAPALLTVASAVHIVAAMTLHALGRRAYEYLILVTIAAHGVHVLAGQRKPRAVVIE
jgi:hypothetical protein